MLYVHFFFSLTLDREKLVIRQDNGISFYGVEQQVAGRVGNANQLTHTEKTREKELLLLLLPCIILFLFFFPNFSTSTVITDLSVAHVSNGRKSPDRARTVLSSCWTPLVSAPDSQAGKPRRRAALHSSHRNFYFWFSFFFLFFLSLLRQFSSNILE